jgi:hypothetical protein
MHSLWAETPMILQPDGEAQPLAGRDVFAGTPYRLVRRLGGGSTRDVFLVEHRELGREMVAKLLPRGLADDAQLLDRGPARSHHTCPAEPPERRTN